MPANKKIALGILVALVVAAGGYFFLAQRQDAGLPGSGEAVKVVIVRKDPGLGQEAVIAHCRAHLAGYKVPRQIEFRDALPKTPIGKVLRRELRNRTGEPGS